MSTEITRYVLGFAFDEHTETVVLIEKQKPDWQKGFHNGVGGKIEGNEMPIDAMRREFTEETGIDITDWKEVGYMYGTTWNCHCFMAITDTSGVYTTENEKVNRVPLEDIFYQSIKCLYNVPHLINCCLDENLQGFVLRYK